MTSVLVPQIKMYIQLTLIRESPQAVVHVYMGPHEKYQVLLSNDVLQLSLALYKA